MSLRDVQRFLESGEGVETLERRLAEAARLRLAEGEIPPERIADLLRLLARAEQRLQSEAARLEARGASRISIEDRRRRLAAVRRRAADVAQGGARWFRQVTPLSYIDAYMESVDAIGVADSVLGRIDLAGAETLVREGARDVALSLEHAVDGLRIREAILTVTGEDIPLGLLEGKNSRVIARGLLGRLEKEFGLLEGKNSRVIARGLARRLEEEFGFTRFCGPGSRSFTTAQLVENLERVGGESFVGFRDRLNRPWKLETYTNMLARTKVQQAHRAGTDAYLQDNELDLVRVSIHGATDSCKSFEGAELSRFGKTPGVPSIESASASSHLFGPNCKHGYTATSTKFRSARTQARIDEANARAEEAAGRSATENERMARQAQRKAA